MIFEDYGHHCRLAASEAVDTERFNEQIDTTLSNPDVKFIHLRNSDVGCYITKIETSFRS